MTAGCVNCYGKKEIGMNIKWIKIKLTSNLEIKFKKALCHQRIKEKAVLHLEEQLHKFIIFKFVDKINWTSIVSKAGSFTAWTCPMGSAHANVNSTKTFVNTAQCVLKIIIITSFIINLTLFDNFYRISISISNEMNPLYGFFNAY